jgi:glycosyltransferase involved in cell wall biosynthesis
MPVYNGERFLESAIRSVLNQTYPHLELVIVDDGSTDRSWEIMADAACADRRVNVVANPTNMGIVTTLNRAIRCTDPRSVYLARMDCDDECVGDRIEHQVAFMQRHADHAVVGGQLTIIDEHGERLGVRHYPTTSRDVIKAITRYNPIPHPGSMIRRTALDVVGAYDQQFTHAEDYDLWLRMAARYPLANLDREVLRYRISSTQVKAAHCRRQLRATIRAQRRWVLHPGLRRVRNVAYFAMEHLLLLAPERVTMAAFKRVTYRSDKHSIADRMSR